MMGAGNVKRVYERWGDLQGPAFRLLTYIAVVIPDRETRPRCELSRESLAYGLGYAVLDDKAERALRRALSSLRVTGALSEAQAAAPGRRAHYWVELSMEPGTDPSPDPTADVDETADTSVRQRGTDVSATEDTSVRLRESDTVLPFSGEEPGDKPGAASQPPPPLRAIPGGNDVSKNKPLPGQRAFNIADLHRVTSSDDVKVVGHPLVQELIDQCRLRDVKLPTSFRSRYGKLIKEAQNDGFADDLIRKALATMIADNVVNRPSLLPARIVAVQTGPERRSMQATRPSTTDATVADAVERGRRLQAEADRKVISS